MARPRGYAPWNPKPASLALVDNVQTVLEEYRAHLPLTVRQIFYRLVGAFGYEKTERAYARLCEGLVRARRAQMIPFDSIRDDGTQESWPLKYDDPMAFWDEVRWRLDAYKRDRQAGQPERIELWCEAAGMAPQLFRVAAPYCIPVLSTGGFSSVTVTHEIAQRAVRNSRNGQDTLFLHVGDYDPSGESIFDAMAEDAGRFAAQYGASFRAVRVALTEDQVADYDLPTAPPKSTDTRSRNWIGETCQAEAMPPDTLAEVVREAIEAQMDLDRFEEEKAREANDRDEIEEILPEKEER